MAHSSVEIEALELVNEVERFLTRYFGTEWVSELAEHEDGNGYTFKTAARKLRARINRTRCAAREAIDENIQGAAS